MKSLRFRIKTIIGVILMILSLLGIFFWESEGREKVLMTPVLVTAREINAGELILGEDIIRINVPGDAVISGGLRPDQASLAEGRIAAAFIPARQQIAPSMLRDESGLLEPGETVFCLESGWIFSRPALLCAGDRLRVYRSDGLDLGSYKAAYLRNSSEQAINAPKRGETLLDRSSEGIIEDIEIVCGAEDYFAILGSVMEYEQALIDGGSYVSNELRRCLIVVVDPEAVSAKIPEGGAEAEAASDTTEPAVEISSVIPDPAAEETSP